MGTLPLLTTYIIKISDISYSPAYVLIASTLIGFIGLIYLKRQTDESCALDKSISSV